MYVSESADIRPIQIPIAFFLLFLGLIFIFAVCDFLLLALLHVELNGEADELGVFLDQILQAALLKELGLILLEIANDFGAAFDLTVDKFGVLPQAETMANW